MPNKTTLTVLAAMKALLIAAPPLFLGAPTGAQAQATPPDCTQPEERGFAAGRRGARPPETALESCPEAAKTWRSAYRAGAYMRSLDRSFGGPGAASPAAPPLTGAASGGHRSTASAKGQTRAALRRGPCSYDASRIAGAAGAPPPPGCAPSSANVGGYLRGRTQRRTQADALQSAAERARINTRLLSPSLSAAERRLIQNRLRTLNQQDGLRRIQDPYLR